MRVKIFKPSKVDSVELVDRYLQSSRPNFKTLKKIKKMKIFAQALTNPNTSVMEAKKMAGIPPAMGVKQFMNNPIGREIWDQYLEDIWTPEVVRDKMKELWDAHEVVVDSFGVERKKPNYEIQDKQLTRVLKLKKWADMEESDPENKPPVKVVFNVMGADIEAKAEVEGANGGEKVTITT